MLESGRMHEIMNKSHLNGRIAAETTYFHVLDDIKTVYYITLQIKCIVCKITIVNLTEIK